MSLISPIPAAVYVVLSLEKGLPFGVSGDFKGFYLFLTTQFFLQCQGGDRDAAGLLYRFVNVRGLYVRNFSFKAKFKVLRPVCWLLWLPERPPYYNQVKWRIGR
jgi:hypothetical protein